MHGQLAEIGKIVSKKKRSPLPGVRVTRQEWEALWAELDKQELEGADKYACRREVREMLYRIQAQRYPKDKVCLVCGEEAKSTKGLCRTCAKMLYYRGVLRSYGHVFGYGYGRNGKPCEACGNPKVYSSRLCRNCYAIKRKFKYETNQDVRNYKLEQHSKVTPVRDITHDEAIQYGYLKK